MGNLNQEQINFLSAHLSFWDNLSDDEKVFLINNTSLIQYKKGLNIHNDGNNCIGILLVNSGCVRTYVLSEDGREFTLYRLHEGEIGVLSDCCILKNISFDTYINTETDCEIFQMNSKAFAELSSNNIFVENMFYKNVNFQFSNIISSMYQILFMSFDRRLAIFLYNELKKTNDNKIYLTHEQIAKYIASAREVVTRKLKDFSDEGIVELNRGSIKVIDREKLIIAAGLVE